jgi:hypothetical protein
MRRRALAVAGVLAVTAAGPAALAAPSLAAKTTTKPHVGQKCSPKKKPPKGFVCKKNKKGHYVLAKKK